MKKLFLVGFIFAFTLLLNNPLYAQSVCDGETGAAHSSCKKYCEVLDCDSLDPNGSDKACDKASAKYENLTGSLPPCACPCVGQLPSFFEGQTFSCDDDIQSPFCGLNSECYTVEILPDQNSDIQLEIYHYMTTNDAQITLEDWACQVSTYEMIDLTETEFLACQSFRDMHCTVP